MEEQAKTKEIVKRTHGVTVFEGTQETSWRSRELPNLMSFGNYGGRQFRVFLRAGTNTKIVRGRYPWILTDYGMNGVQARVETYDCGCRGS